MIVGEFLLDMDGRITLYTTRSKMNSRKAKYTEKNPFAVG